MLALEILAYPSQRMMTPPRKGSLLLLRDVSVAAAVTPTCTNATAERSATIT
jgi:hypothetical protein